MCTTTHVSLPVIYVQVVLFVTGPVCSERYLVLFGLSLYKAIYSRGLCFLANLSSFDNVRTILSAFIMLRGETYFRPC